MLQLGVERLAVLSCAPPGWAASSIHAARTEETTRNIPTFAVNNAFIFSPSPLGDTRSCHIRLFHLSQYPHLPEPPPNSQHAPVLRNPPRPTATPPRRGAAHIPSRERNPPRPTATPPRRGVFPIPSLEGWPRVSGGVGCPLPGPSTSSGPPPSTGLRTGLQGGNYIQGYPVRLMPAFPPFLPFPLF